MTPGRLPFLIGALFVLQLACALVFMSDMLSAVLPFLPAPRGWRGRELIEIGAAVGLVTGLCLTAWLFRRTLDERNRAEAGLRRASGAFITLLDERFGEWGLTLAERDVSIFLIKGMSTAEIATLRATSEGTVKSQTNAIYRKAGVAGRQQLLSLFIEDLIGDRPAVPPGSAERVGQSAA
jgi:DNA-binding CsgD family transcriptional regulator